MNNSIFLKTVTLCSFAFLISGFVAYKAGILSPFFQNTDPATLQLSPNGSQIQSNAINTPVHYSADSSLIDSFPPFNPAMISSKSMILRDIKSIEGDTFVMDTLTEEERQHKRMMMYSSKSGPIFQDDFIKELPPPTEKGEKRKRKRKKEEQDSILLKQQTKQQQMMPGSKAPIIIDRQ